MQKTILAILGSALIAASLTQAAAAAEHHKARKVVRAPAAASEQFRNSNDYYAPEYGPTTTLPQPSRSEIQRYENGAESAPAGH
jgi:type II secretory pathway pseudopilin PulG